MQAMTVALNLKAKDGISPIVSKVNVKLSSLEAKSKQVGRTAAKVGAVSLAGFGVMSAPVGSVVNSYQDLAKAQGEIESLGVHAKGIKAITTEARAFSNTFSGTTQADFVRASYDIKSGISSLSDVGVAKFTGLAALTGKATKSTTTQMTSFFATGYGIYSKQFDALSAKTVAGWNALSQEEKDIKFGEYFAAGIAGAVKEFKTNGGQMQSAIEALGATATTSNVPLAAQLAILGTLQKSMSGSEAATKYKAFLNAAAGAQKKLKLSFLDSNNQLKSTPEILEELRRKYGNTLDDMEKQSLKKAFGTDEALAYITALYDETGNLRSAQKRLSKTMQSGTDDVLTMAIAMNKGLEFELLQQKIGNLTTVIGKQFAPMALKIASKIGDITKSVTTWIEANPELVETITEVVLWGGALLGGLGALAIGFSAVAFLISPFVKTIKGIGWALGKFGAKSTTTSVAVKALSGTLDDIAGKSVSARLGVVTPKKAMVLGKFKGVVNALKAFALANVITITAVVAYTALDAYNKTDYAQQASKTTALGGDQRLVNQYKKEENTPEALKTVSVEQAVEAKIRQDDWRKKSKKIESKFDIQAKVTSIDVDEKAIKAYLKTIENATTKTIQAKNNVISITPNTIGKNDRNTTPEKIHKVELSNPIVKKVDYHKKIDVHAPVNITINTTQEVDANKLGSMIQNSLQSAVRKANTNSNNSYEDKD